MTQKKNAPDSTNTELITFRFDKIDTTLGKLDDKVEKMYNSYVHRNEITIINQRLSGLESTDNRQEGSIEANRRFTTISLAILSIVAAVAAAYVGLHK